MTLSRRTFGLGTAAIALTATTGASFAQAYPARPIRMILPLSAGSTVDILIRKMQEALASELGQGLVIENLPGAGGVPATDLIARSQKDGYTLGMVSSNHVVAPNVIKDIPYDAVKDFTVMSVVAGSALALVVNAESPFKTAKDLIDAAKAKPGDITYGSSGNGTILHLACVLFAKEAGIDLKHVPYKGVAPMLTDLLGGVTNCVITSLASVQSHVASGKLRMLAVTSRGRDPAAPNVPSLAESGLPNYDYGAWIAMVGPAALPQPVLDKVQKSVKAALAKPDIKDALGKAGLNIIGTEGPAAQAFLAAEAVKHADLVKLSGAKAE